MTFMTSGGPYSGMTTAAHSSQSYLFRAQGWATSAVTAVNCSASGTAASVSVRGTYSPALQIIAITSAKSSLG